MKLRKLAATSLCALGLGIGCCMFWIVMTSVGQGYYWTLVLLPVALCFMFFSIFLMGHMYKGRRFRQHLEQYHAVEDYEWLWKEYHELQVMQNHIAPLARFISMEGPSEARNLVSDAFELKRREFNSRVHAFWTTRNRYYLDHLYRDFLPPQIDEIA
jgi:hypothetical protein